MKLKRAIAASVLVSAFAAPAAAGTFEDAVDAYARGDYAKALHPIRPLANDGDATAQFNLGLMYTTGQGVQQDNAAAALWFRRAAEQGYAPAQSNLGTVYLYGRGVTQDDTEAVAWFRKAADQGDAIAEFLLGNQYANGKGVPQDYSEAMIWFQRAAEQGHPVAKLYLGVMYAESRGVPQDYVRAHMWFSLAKLAAAQGEQSAVKTLEMAERRTPPAQISDKRSAKARTRLEASQAANSSLKKCALRPVSPNLQPDNAAWSAPLGTAVAPSATSAANKGFIGDGAVVSYLNDKGDNYETYDNGTNHCVRGLQHLRICPHSSSRVERPDPSHV